MPDRIRYTFFCYVKRITEMADTRWIRGTGQEAEFEEVKTGQWVIGLPALGGYIIMFEKPTFTSDARIKITIEEAPLDAEPK